MKKGSPVNLSKENGALKKTLARRTAELEQKTRELEIEASLDKVRAVAMRMKKREDMPGICKAIAKQLERLGVKDIRNVQTAVFYEEKGVYMNYEYYTKHDKTFITETSYTNHKIAKAFAAKMINGKGQFFETRITGTKVKDWITYQKTTNVFIDRYLNTASSLNYYWHSLGPVALGMSAYARLEKEALKLFERFLNVFELAYLRFLDIKKAEAQAREAQIELSLERVRSRAMAMQHSNELEELIGTVFTELTKLDLILTRCIIWVFEPATNAARWWMANSEEPSNPMNFYIKYHEHPAYLSFVKEWKRQNVKFVYDLKGKDKVAWDKVLFNETELKQLPDAVKKGMQAPERVLLSGSFNNFGGINTASLEPLSDEHFEILLRFAKVFDLTYTRFLDLQKAEAQAKEAKIDAALERIRSRALAMHNSEELVDVATVLREQMGLLGQPDLESSIIHLYDGDNKAFTAWYAFSSGDDKIITGITSAPKDTSEWAREVIANYQSSKTEYTIESSGKKLAEWYKVLTQVAPATLQYDKKGAVIIPEILYYHFSKFTGGALLMISNKKPSQEACELQRKAAIVFELAYTRFLDLQKAEAQAREAQIQAALERVRSKAMAMHNSQDLSDTIHEFYNELQTFSITPRRCGVGLLDKESRSGELFTWNTTDKGESLELVGRIIMQGHPVLENVYNGWLTQTDYYPVLRGNEIKEYYKVIRPQINFPDYATDEVQYGYFFFFNEGGVYAWTQHEMKDAELQIYRRFTSVLSLTYKRYKDLQLAEALARQAELDLVQLKAEKRKTEEALSELQTTQKQLIHSEKMASLGELTAGIAHEIQNPLNFVNNFSEVSAELVDEMNLEIQEGNLEEARQIASDLKQNLEKINHHGKRAGEIVKGMLQHSRSGTGQKEKTDINALADEYLRLAYHGLRAKDKSFNATLETDFDTSIRELSIVPQDIGRVILNLITNAFYAVNERKKECELSGMSFGPSVSVQTKRSADTIAIKVSDNGNGIPKKVLDKIFQPFFTTKPTGEGTGLGLSLSYDIVKAHGGTLEVDTRQGVGTSFIILLPA